MHKLHFDCLKKSSTISQFHARKLRIFLLIENNFIPNMNNNDCCTKYFNLCLDAKHLLNNEIKVENIPRLLCLERNVC
jgi:hypothetical protein